MRESWRNSRLVLVLVLGVELVLLALWPLAARLDGSIDEGRVLMDDVHEMAVLQGRLVADGGQPETLEVPDGDAVEVGGTTFEPAAGVSVAVTTETDEWCVVATSGDRRETRCWDTDADPETVAGRDPEA